MAAIACVIALTLGLASPPASGSLEDLITQAAATGHMAHREAALELVRRIDNSTDVIEQPFLERLCDVVKDPAVNGAVRFAVLDLVCRKVDKPNASRIQIGNLGTSQWHSMTIQNVFAT